jgi:rubrerythrin
MSPRAATRKPVKRKPPVAKAVAAKRSARRPAARRAPAKSDAYRKFLAQAHAMEREAAQRYDELADQMEVHNNAEVAALFRKMAEIERKHAARVLGSFPETPVEGGSPSLAIGVPELPETISNNELHYLMPPYHALGLALESEQRAVRFFDRIAGSSKDAKVRAAARQLAGEERQHVRLVKEWMQKVPKPAAGWDYDPDPPNYTE